MDLSDTLKHVEILRIFKDDLFSTIPTAEIETRLGLSHHPTFRKLKILERNDILIKQKGGYSLNIQNELVFEIMRFLSNIEKIEKNARTRGNK